MDITLVYEYLLDITSQYYGESIIGGKRMTLEIATKDHGNKKNCIIFNIHNIKFLMKFIYFL